MVFTEEALVLSARYGWGVGYAACAVFALPAMLTALVLGEPERRKVVVEKKGLAAITSVKAAGTEYRSEGRCSRSGVRMLEFLWLQAVMQEDISANASRILEL